MLNLKVVCSVIVVLTFFIAAASSEGVIELLDSEVFKEKQIIELLYSAEKAERHEEIMIAIKELTLRNDNLYNLNEDELKTLSAAYKLLRKWRKKSLEKISEIIDGKSPPTESQKDLLKRLMRVIIKELDNPCTTKIDAELYPPHLNSVDNLVDLVRITLKANRQKEMKLAMKLISKKEGDVHLNIDQILFLHDAFMELLKSRATSLKEFKKLLKGSSDYKETIHRNLIKKVKTEQVDICQQYVDILDKTLKSPLVEEGPREKRERFCYLILKAKTLSTKRLAARELGISESQVTDVADPLDEALKIKLNLRECDVNDYWRCVFPVFEYYNDEAKDKEKACELGRKAIEITDNSPVKKPSFLGAVFGMVKKSASWKHSYKIVENECKK